MLCTAWSGDVVSRGSVDVVKGIKWGRREQGTMRMVWTGWSGDVVNRALWECYEQGAVGMLWTECSRDVNRVQWGCCEEGDERSISTKEAKYTTSRDTAVSDSLGCAVSSARRHLSLKEDNQMFRVGCQCCECAVLGRLKEMHGNWRRHENYANCSTLHSGKGWGCGWIFQVRGDLQAIGDESV